MTKGTIGLVGAGTMGRALAENLAGHGLAVIVADADVAKARAAAGRGIEAVGDLAALLAALPAPRTVLLMVPAGAAVDDVLDAPDGFRSGDIVIDGGNSHPDDTTRRAETLGARGATLLGFGISGGEAGARTGPAIMAGGPADILARLAPCFEAIAAKADGEPCFARVGPAAAGHAVKTLHNGIEYALMQSWAEGWLLLRDGLGLAHERIAATFESWRDGPLASFLLDASCEALRLVEPGSTRPAIAFVADRAGQKGTGAWSSELALRTGVAAPTLAAAVFARNLAATRGASVARAEVRRVEDAEGMLADLAKALLGAQLAAFVQGFAVIRGLSEARRWDVPQGRIARLWQGGSIVRSALLRPIATAFERHADLLVDREIARLMRDTTPPLRRIVAAATAAALPMPALASALAWIDGLSARGLGADLIAAQRDLFGAHGFERTDRPGLHHFARPRT